MLLLLALLATLPPELLAKAQGWDWVDPAYLALTAAWWPADLALRLALLKRLAFKGQGRSVAQAWRGALAMELLLSLRLAVVGLACLVPGAALLSVLGLESPGARLSVILALGLGLLPALAYSLARALAPLHLLEQTLSPGAALNRSAQSVRGHWRPYLLALLPWTLLSLALDGAGLALPDQAAWILAPLSLLAELKGLQAGWQSLSLDKNPVK